MTTYQHYIYNKAKEAREAIDECMCDQVNKDPYSYFHGKLANYVSVKAKEEHVSLKNLPRELYDYLDQASTDYVMNGKKLIDCYKEIDELFKKIIPDKKEDTTFTDTYKNVSNYITSSSIRMDANVLDVVDHLTRNGHAPTEMAALLMTGKLGFDDFFALVDDAINEVKNGHEGSICKVNEIAGEINSVIETAKHLKGYKYDHIDLNDDQLIIFWRKDKK